MLISKKHLFVFVHIYKTGGTSITAALSPFTTSRTSKRLNKLLKPIGILHYEPRPYFKHATASEIIAQMGKKKYNSYFSFSFVRNPWDWQVSLYHYVLRDKTNRHHEIIKSFSGFDDYIRWRCAEEVRHQREFVYSPKGEKQVDYIGKFELLNDNFNYVCGHIGIDAQLPHLNASKRKPYRTYYNDQTAMLVQEAYQPDIDLFDYRF